jgi:protein TonB
MRHTYLLLFLIILFISNAFGQNENDNCPPLFTRSKIKISKATITRIEVVDSNKFTKLPEFVLSLDSLSKLIKGPEIAARAGVTGDAIIKIKINFNGYVSIASILRGIGAGCDEATLEVLMKSKFHPAKIGDEKAESEIKVWVNFYLIEIIDEPDIYIDEIKYEVYYNLIKNQTVLKFNKIGEAYYFESQNYKKVSKKEGNIPLGFFTKLNDFIISQCFQNYKYRYNSTENFPEPVITITVKIGSTDYYVTFRESDNIPVGLWALNKLILHVKDHIQWKEVKE